MTRLNVPRFSRYWQMFVVVRPYCVLLSKTQLRNKCLGVYKITHRYEIDMSMPPMTRSAFEIRLRISELFAGYIMALKNVSHTIKSILKWPSLCSALHLCIQTIT